VKKSALQRTERMVSGGAVLYQLFLFMRAIKRRYQSEKPAWFHVFPLIVPHRLLGFHAEEIFFAHILSLD
jgi:hypothetical protein